MTPLLAVLLGAVLGFIGGFAAAGAILSSYWTKRVELLEAEVKRRASEDTRLDLEDEVRRLDEKVEFLEALLADRPNADALPPGDMDDSGEDKPRAD